MRYCATFLLPDGTVHCLRPNHQLVAALLSPWNPETIAILNHIGISISLALDFKSAMPAQTEEEAVRVIAARDAPRVAERKGFRRTDVTNLIARPDAGLLDGADAGLAQRRRFRASWKAIGNAVPAVDMLAARTQRMNDVRAQRDTKLVKSDLDFVKAQEAADLVKQAAIKTYRQALRDLPATEGPAVDALATPEALAAWEPTWPIVP